MSQDSLGNRIRHTQPGHSAAYAAPQIMIGPAPQLGFRIFGPKRRYSHYDYGCNFCDAHFTSYGSYESHVQGCDHRPSGSRIQCEDWDESGYDEYCRRDGDRYEERDRGDYYDNDDRDYRGNDGYDDRDDDGYYDDGR